MSDVTITVDAGACRFKTIIKAKGSDDFMSVDLVIKSECPNVRKLAAELKTADPIDTVSTAIVDNAVIRKCSIFIPHPACPIPCAIVKACEVAGDMAVKKNVTFVFE